ncbi:MAG: V-type ATP synthase subunit F [Firmicutes bacterium]|jgi:V/A-type H+-transporting ATPase subunit F|nr:V-type ATP synthase subunit F [Bacillota bacterium]NLL87613.1 V-type ATP synthase subunit F [Bacillota bacterium]
MYKIGVIGDQDSILGFKAIGMSVFPAEGSEQAGAILEQLAREDYAVVYITEQIAKDLADVIDRYKDRLMPAIILIPSNQGSLGIGMRNVQKSVERAIGADILFRDA